MIKLNILVYRGETYQRNITISNFTRTITNLYFTVKKTDSDETVALQKTIGNGLTLMDYNEETNTYTYLLELCTDDTENLKTGDYGYDITITAEDYKKPIVMGRFRIEAVYTTKKDEVK